MVGIATRLFGLTSQAFSNDEVWELLAIQQSWSHRIFEPDGFPPLHRILLSVVVDVVGFDDAGRWLSVVFGVLVIPLCCLTARQVLEDRPRTEIRRGMLWAGMLAATSPLLVFYSQECRAYAQFHFVAALFVVTSIWALKSDSVASWGWTIAIAVIGCFTHYYFTLLAACLGIGWLFAASQTGRWQRGLISAAAFVALLLPVLYLLKADFEFSRGYGSKTDFQLIGIPYTFFTLVAGYGFGPGVGELHDLSASQAAQRFLPWVLACGVLSIPTWLLGVSKVGHANRANPSLVFLVSVSLLPGLIAAVVAMTLDMPFNVRYVSESAIPCIILIGIGVSSIRQPRLSSAIGMALVVLFTWSQARRTQIDRYQNEDVRSAAAYLAKLPDPQAPTFVIADYMERTLRFYTGPDVNLQKFPDPHTDINSKYIRDQDDLDEARALLRTALQEHGDCTLVVTRAFHGDNDRLLRNWLATTNEFRLDVEYAGLKIYRSTRNFRGDRDAGS